MAWHDTDYPKRLVASFVASGATFQLEIKIDTDFADFWDQIDTNGHGIRVCGPDGVSLLTYEWASFNKPNRTGTIRVGNFTLPASSGDIAFCWIYYGIESGSESDASGSVTLTASIASNALVRNASTLAFEYIPPDPDDTAPAVTYSKGTADEVYVWIDVAQVLESTKYTQSGRLHYWEEAFYAEISSQDSAGASASVAVASSSFFQETIIGSQRRMWLAVRLSGGTSGTAYTVKPLIHTVLPETVSVAYRSIEARFGLVVRDQVEPAV